MSEQDKVQMYIDRWQKLAPDATIVVTSALHKFNVEKVFYTILDNLPESPAYFPKDSLTDKTERFFVEEIIREKILKHYKKEIPYSTQAIVEEFKEEEKIIRIRVNIFVERESQKPIIIGNKGAGIKRIGTEAREDIEEFFNKKVYLDLFVKVSKNWRNNDNRLKEFGYSS